MTCAPCPAPETRTSVDLTTYSMFAYRARTISPTSSIPALVVLRQRSCNMSCRKFFPGCGILQANWMTSDMAIRIQGVLSSPGRTLMCRWMRFATISSVLSIILPRETSRSKSRSRCSRRSGFGSTSGLTSTRSAAYSRRKPSRRAATISLPMASRPSLSIVLIIMAVAASPPPPSPRWVVTAGCRGRCGRKSKHAT